jgi:uncharacterized protein YbjT (DUF2867 family)
MKRILILGATGRTGKLAVDYALSKPDLEVTVLVRDKSQVAPRDNLRIVEGTPMQRADVERAIEGCYAVVSFLNNQRTSDSPWAKQKSPTNLMAASIANCVSVMKVRDIRRIVVLSSAGVGDSFRYSPWLFRMMIEKTGLKVAFDDHAAQEQVLRESGLDWTAVRAAALLGSKVKKTIISYDNVPKPHFAISRNQTAVFMIDCLLHPEFYGKAPVASA